MPKIIPNLSTDESKKFWASVEKAAGEVRKWPDSRRAGINVSETRTQVQASSPSSQDNGKAK